MRLLGITLVLFGTITIVSLEGGCTLLSGAVDLQTCATSLSCDLETSQDNVVPRAPATAGDGDGGGGTTNNNDRNTTPTSPTGDASTTTPDAASAPPGGSKNPIPCDGTMCSGATPICCQLANAKAQCTATASECVANPAGAALACGSSADCLVVGQVCCANAPLRTAQCATSCTGPEKRELCDDEETCIGDAICVGPSAMFQHDYCEPF